MSNESIFQFIEDIILFDCSFDDFFSLRSFPTWLFNAFFPTFLDNIGEIHFVFFRLFSKAAVVIKQSFLNVPEVVSVDVIVSAL